MGMPAAEREFGKPPLSREELLDAPLLQLHGCSLSLTCFDGCTKPGSLKLQQMAASYGKGLQLRRALARLRCRGCRRPPAAVTICDHPTPDALPTWRVVLMP
jgi:hypothetical protein